LPVKALVIGAAGHLGNAVTRALINRGYEVTAAGRRPEPPINLRGLAIRYLSGDIETAGQIDSWVDGHEVVIDAAAPYPSRLMPSAQSAAAAVEQAGRRTLALIGAVRRQRARLAYVSSFATLPDRSTGFERARRQWIRGLHPYFAVKQRIEADILAAARTGLPAVIVNPTLCAGPWDIKDRELCFVPRVLSGEAPITVTHSVNVIDVRDAADGLIAALESERYGEPILLAGHNISVAALYTWISEMGGIAPPRVAAPISLGVIAAYWSEIALGAIGVPPPLPVLAPMLTILHDAFDPSPIQTELGVVPGPLSRTLADAIEWYRQIGYC
jgi:dihydroflavonol-4-reductase